MWLMRIIGKNYDFNQTLGYTDKFLSKFSDSYIVLIFLKILFFKIDGIFT